MPQSRDTYDPATGAKIANPVTAGDPTQISAVIPNTAGYLSPGVKVSGKVVGLITPAAWSAASLTFQGSRDGTNYFDLYDDAVERAIASGSIPISAQRMLSLDLNDWLCVNYIKLRSGPSSLPVAQAAARTFILIMAG